MSLADRRFRLSALLLAACAGLGFVPAQAGTVQVSFADPERFADAGDRPAERDANLKVIAAFLVQLGERRLAADQTLAIEVTDVDLAGTVRRTSLHPLRVANGGADWPRIGLRYTLQSDGQTSSSGEETLRDMNYLMNIRALAPAEPLRIEKRMLQDWFEARFVAGQTASSSR